MNSYDVNAFLTVASCVTLTASHTSTLTQSLGAAEDDLEAEGGRKRREGAAVLSTRSFLPSTRLLTLQGHLTTLVHLTILD